MSLQSFINQYTGVSNVGDTPENRGECVGLIEVWTDSLGLPHTWGNAKDLLANADRNAFEVIPNTESNFPLPGDVLCFNGRWGGGYGHTGIVVSADANTFTLLEQNNPTGSSPHQVFHPNYSNVQGWMRPINKGGDMNDIADYNYVNWVAQVCFFRIMSVEEYKQFHHNKTKAAVWEEFAQSDEGTKKRQEIGATYTQRDQLIGKVGDLTSQGEAQQKTIEALNKQIEVDKTAREALQTTPAVQPPASTVPAPTTPPAAPSESRWANLAKQVHDFFGTTQGRALLGVVATVVTPIVMALQNFHTDNAVLAAAVLAAVTLLNTVKDAFNPNVPNK